MKKSVAILLALMCFFAGCAGGLAAGFFLSPVKNGLTLNPSAVNSGNVYVGKKKKKKNKKEKTSDKKFSFDRKNEE